MQAFDLGLQRMNSEWQQAYCRNQSHVAVFLTDLIEETHFALAADPAIAPRRNIQNAADAYTRKYLIEYLASRAPQL